MAIAAKSHAGPLLIGLLFCSVLARAEVTYTNFTRPGPIEIHLLKIPRLDHSLQIRSIHGGGEAIKRSPLTEQLKQVRGGAPVAAVNGDFFQLDGAFAGDPRGLQIVDGALISAPVGTAAFWIDSGEKPHIGLVRSALRVTWPNGSNSPLVLNERCDTNEIALYTSGIKATQRGDIEREIVLRPADGPLCAGNVYSLTVEEIRESSGAPIPPGALLMSLGTSAIKSAPPIRVGSILKISTATIPNMRNVPTAISGGPLLIISGTRQRFDKAESNAFRHRFMVEKHPRTAIGWSDKEFIWVEVDGRSKDSIGMTLNELGELMIEFGCIEAMNLDGGGSSTFWYDGKVRNRPSDGNERPVANSLVLVRRPVP